MISLQNRFKKVYTKVGACQQPFPNGKLVLNSDHSLVYKMDIGSSCGVDDDVEAYAIDERNNIWYSKYTDLTQGKKTVYKFSFSEFSLRMKGVIDKQGGFIYRENDNVYRESKTGEKRMFVDVSALKDLMAIDNDMKYLTVEKIEHTVSFYMNDKEYSNEELLDDMLDLYNWMTVLCGEAQRGKDINSVASELILKIFRLCSCCKDRSRSDIVSELRERLKMKVI